MRRTALVPPSLRALLLAVALLGLAACDDDGGGNGPADGDAMLSETSDGDTSVTPDGSDDADSVEPDGDATQPDGDTSVMPDSTDTSDQVDPDSTDTDMPPIPVDRVVCANTLPTPSSGLCTVAQGSATLLQLEGTILAGDKIYENGRVLIDRSSANGTITCVGCDCADASATVVSCPDGVISPALINAHDHITYNLSQPAQWDPERFEHRHDWRRGRRGHTRVDTNPGSDSSREAVLYHEIRLLLGGATSVAGSGGAAGLVRNLDQANNSGLPGVDVDYNTFPLDDGGTGVMRSNDCNYPRIDPESRARNAPIYLPHIAEGIDIEARNEFRCMSDSMAGEDLILPTTSVVHGIGLTGYDMQLMADRGASLVWSPRSNISLYGDTATVTGFRNLGVNIALGTDWTASGSMNMLRELACADYLNTHHYSRTFSDYELWSMATSNAAIAMGAQSHIGTIAAGYVADITIFDGSQRSDYRAVIEASVEDVLLVMRGGQPLVGLRDLIADLPGGLNGCDTLSLAPCGADRAVCVQRDAGLTLQQINAAVAASPSPNELPPYALFFCGTPDREPTCVPIRPDDPSDSAVYTGMTSAGDIDGDGVPNDVDNCPTIFNPRRSFDGPGQADADNDGIGDACDPCILSPTDECTPADPNDRDSDGVPNASDNCPSIANPQQEDADMDGIGDACDACPAFANPGGAPCEFTVYDLKRPGVVQDGTQVILRDVVVTAVNNGEGIFVQVPTTSPNYAGAEFSGIYLFTRNSTGITYPARGACVDIAGRVTTYNGQRELEAVTDLTVITPCAHAVPTPVTVNPADVSTSGMLREEYEGVLITVQNVTVTAIDSEFDFVTVTGGLILDRFFFDFAAPTIGQTYATVSGVLRWAYSSSRLEPRDAGDMGPPSLLAFAQPLVYVRAGESVDVPVSLSAAATAPATVQITYQNASGVLSGASSVLIPQGQSSANLALSGTASSTTPVTVTATYDGVSESFDVRVFSDAEARTLVALTPATTTVTIGQQATFTVRLNLPAPAGGSVVDLASDDPSVTVPVTVIVPAGQFETTFAATAVSEGEATISASLGGGTPVTSAVTVSGRVLRGVLFSEYVEGSSNNKAFEIVNDTGAPLNLANCSVRLYSNGNSSPGSTLTFAAGTTLADRDVFVVCHAQFSNKSLCDLDHGVANYNGDDVLELLCNGSTVDVFGQIGNDPGDAWTGGGISTLNQTLRRKCSVTGGDPIGNNAFDPSVEWDGFPIDTFNNLGQNHFTSCP